MLLKLTRARIRSLSPASRYNQQIHKVDVLVQKLEQSKSLKKLDVRGTSWCSLFTVYGMHGASGRMVRARKKLRSVTAAKGIELRMWFPFIFDQPIMWYSQNPCVVAPQRRSCAER